ncbi:hypothetical protein GF413_00530 [Candidatus Micrarchaeota archaeon]|nr:hypothetical protein [Candidatus Micrarchaeota archaeon]
MSEHGCNEELEKLKKRKSAADDLFRICCKTDRPYHRYELPTRIIFKDILDTYKELLQLLESDSVHTAPVLLRTVLEKLIHLEFICQDENLYELKSKAWLYNYVKNRTRGAALFTNKSQTGKEFEKYFIEKYGAPPSQNLINFDDPENHGKWREWERVKEDLAKELIDEITKFQKNTQTKGSEKKSSANAKKETAPDPWYNLWNDCKGIEQLSKQVKLWDYYQIFYRRWSEAVHGSDIDNIISETQEGYLRWGVENVEEKMSEYCEYANQLLSMACRNIYQKVLDHDERQEIPKSFNNMD